EIGRAEPDRVREPAKQERRRRDRQARAERGSRGRAVGCVRPGAHDPADGGGVEEGDAETGQREAGTREDQAGPDPEEREAGAGAATQARTRARVSPNRRVTGPARRRPVAIPTRNS